MAMTKNSKHTVCADHEWLTNLAKSVKEDKEVIMELAQRIKKNEREYRPREGASRGHPQ